MAHRIFRPACNNDTVAVGNCNIVELWTFAGWCCWLIKHLHPSGCYATALGDSGSVFVNSVAMCAKSTWCLISGWIGRNCEWKRISACSNEVKEHWNRTSPDFLQVPKYTYVLSWRFVFSMASSPFSRLLNKANIRKHLKKKKTL